MTTKELIEKLKEYPENMQVEVCVPEDICDDGYVETYRTCKVDDICLSSIRPAVQILYDRTLGVVE